MAGSVHSSLWHFPDRWPRELGQEWSLVGRMTLPCAHASCLRLRVNVFFLTAALLFLWRFGWCYTDNIMYHHPVN